ncbi:MAG: hypothetical protein JXR10_17175 [Cyclobacteriaceae bacterium]
MKEDLNQEQQQNNNETPDWLKAIQLNSWEAELLISALFLYILFQIPEVIETYRKVHFDSGDAAYRILEFFQDALVVLSIGYVVHIVARGIWVANVGLSYVFPEGMNLDKLKLKGKFRQELEQSSSLNNSVLTLERIASITYAISFMCSAMVLSFGMSLFTVLLYIRWILIPAIESGDGAYYMITLFVLLIYALILLLVFIDFITNGFFRRDSWAAKPYYYIALVFRVITLSFIYNRMLLTIVSSLPKWKAHLIPILFVAFLVLFELGSDYLDENQFDKYYERSFSHMRHENYESTRNEGSILIATIQDEIIEENVLRLYVRNLEEFRKLQSKDPRRSKEWHELNSTQRLELVDKFLYVSIDSTQVEIMNWVDYKHAVTFQRGYLTFINLGGVPAGDHRLNITLDTASMLDEQKAYLEEFDESRVLQASIPFYKAD